MKRARHACLRGLFCLLAGAWLVIVAQPVGAALELTFADLSTGDLRLHGVELRLPGRDGDSGGVRIRQLTLAGRHWSSVDVRCGSIALANGVFQCSDGRIRGIDGLHDARLFLRVDSVQQMTRARLAVAGGILIFDQVAGGTQRIQVRGLTLSALAGLWGGLPEGMEGEGRLDGNLAYQAGRWVIELTGSELAFSDASGMRAGEGLSFVVSGVVDASSPSRIGWTARLRWQAGDVFWNPILVSSGWQIEAHGQVDAQWLEIETATLSGPGLPHARAEAKFALTDRRLESAGLVFDGAELAQLIPQFVLPLVVPDQVERWRVAGRANGSMVWRSGALREAALTLDDAGFSYLGQRFRVGPIRGELPWRRDEPTQWSLDVDGLRWQNLVFDPFSLMARVSEDQLMLMPARLPVLDGAIVIDALSFAHKGDTWRGAGSLYAEPVSLAALTDALDLPRMQGTLSIAVPGITVTPDRIGLDGALVMSVFDGYLQATGLEITDPFGLLPRLTAKVSAEHLDLTQLTQTFSFGSVSGFIDANVDGLVLAKWRPVRFDAQVRSAPGDYPRRISQRAVENITALGGAGAMAAVQRSVLRLFNDFGYREIGLSCRLRANVCQMAGLDGDGPDDAPFKLVAGGGIPALDVIGYNRRVDWAELIERLKRAVSDGAEPIVK